MGWGHALRSRVFSPVYCQEGWCECCSIRRGLEGASALHLLQRGTRTTKVPPSPAMLLYPRSALSCSLKSHEPSQLCLLTGAVLHWRVPPSKKKPQNTMTKLQISGINLFPLTSLKSLQLHASLSEQVPDPEPFKQSLWLSNRSGLWCQPGSNDLFKAEKKLGKEQH